MTPQDFTRFSLTLDALHPLRGGTLCCFPCEARKLTSPMKRAQGCSLARAAPMSWQPLPQTIKVFGQAFSHANPPNKFVGLRGAGHKSRRTLVLASGHVASFMSYSFGLERYFVTPSPLRGEGWVRVFFIPLIKKWFIKPAFSYQDNT
jgi:hypothetical protein